MGDIPGADLLMNPSAMGDTKLPELESVSLDFPEFEPVTPAAAPPPKLVPTAEEAGPTKSWDGMENFNAEPYNVKHISMSSPQVSEDALMKEKYELLRKFERLQKQMEEDRLAHEVADAERRQKVASMKKRTA